MEKKQEANEVQSKMMEKMGELVNKSWKAPKRVTEGEERGESPTTFASSQRKLQKEERYLQRQQPWAYTSVPFCLDAFCAV